MYFIKVAITILLVVAAFFVGRWQVLQDSPKLVEVERDVRGEEAELKKREWRQSELPVSFDVWQEMEQDALVDGKPEAMVLLLVLADEDCEGCRHFWRETYPKILEKYVYTGKIKVWKLPFSRKNLSGEKVASGLAQYMGTETNPSFWVGLQKLEGAQPYISFESILDIELAKKK